MRTQRRNAALTIAMFVVLVLIAGFVLSWLVPAMGLGDDVGNLVGMTVGGFVGILTLLTYWILEDRRDRLRHQEDRATARQLVRNTDELFSRNGWG